MNISSIASFYPAQSLFRSEAASQVDPVQKAFANATERLQKAQRQGLHVSVWTVNEPALMRRLADFGVDSLITDFPGLATATLGNS